MAMVESTVVGYTISKLLDEVLNGLRHLKNRSANLLEIQNLLERLQPSVQELSSLVRDEKQPAGKWLIKLREQLEKARELVTTSSNVNRNIFKLVGTSKKSVELYGKILKLLQEAPGLLLASAVSAQRILAESSDKLAQMTASQEKVELYLHGLSKLTSDTNMKRKMSEFAAVAFASQVSDGSSSSAAQGRMLLAQGTCDVPKPEVSFGGEAVANELINHLLNEDCKKWVGLWGMGGIGKTFTASKVYYDPNIQRHFSGGMFWLTVSKDQASPNHLFKQLLKKLEGRESVSQLPNSLEMAKAHLTNILDRDRVLLVLDDVWQQDVLNYLDVLPEAKGGVILVTTRDQGILRPVIDVVKIFEVPRLSIDGSWELFSWHAFHVRGKMVPRRLETVAKEVAEECQGLPLALEVIGSTMADKQLLPCEVALGRTILQEWESTLEHLRSANYGDSEYERLYYKLQLSVDSLREQDFRLKDCFFYFAAFPEDHLMDVEEVVHMWIAEGLVSNDERIFFSSEEKGKVLVGILIAKSMIQLIDSGGKHPHCRVHDVMRDLIMRNLKWDFATRERIQVSARECLYAPGLKLSNFPEEWIIPNVPLSAKRLSLQDNDLQQMPHPKELNCPHLQVLILSENLNLQSLFPSFIQKLSNLRVLSLVSTPIKEIPGALLKRLKALKLLDLSNCCDLQSVSDKVDSLQHLEIFLITGTNLRKLPRMNNLTKLKYLSADAPSQQLTKGQRSAFGKSTMLPANLKRLDWSGSGDTQQKVAINLSSVRALEQLSLNFIKAFPTGMMKLHHLKILDITYTGETPWIPLGELPLLEDLSIRFETCLDTQLFGDEGGFPSLKYFWVSCEVGVDKLFVLHQGAMPKLERLEVTVKRREQLPASLVELRGLIHLFLRVGGIVSEQRINTLRNEDLEVLFNQKDCFPSLEYLGIALFSHITPEEISLPAHIVERENEGKLRVELTKE